MPANKIARCCAIGDHGAIRLPNLAPIRSASFVARMSQIAFFTRDGDMRDRRSPDVAPHSAFKRTDEGGALIRATILLQFFAE